MSHSPFPWSTHPQAPTSIFDADGMKVAATLGRNAADNAALIAAVPEMVAALQDIVKHMDGNGMQDWTVAKKARAVLASIGQTP